MQIAIETGIPVPAKPVRGGKYPFDQMKVGDSFIAELEGKTSLAFIYNAISAAQKKHSTQYTTRLLKDGTRRIWRVS